MADHVTQKIGNVAESKGQQKREDYMNVCRINPVKGYAKVGNAASLACDA